MNETLLWGGAAMGLVLLLALLIRLRHLWMPLLFSAATGLGALLAVNAAGAFTGIVLPLNALALGTAVAGGIPGVITLLLLRLLWGGG